MREVLEAVAAGELSPTEAEAQLAGYVTTDAGRFDAAREQRRGAPEGILAEGKTAAEVADLATTALDSTGRALVTRVSEADAEAVADAVADSVEFNYDSRSRTLVAQRADFEQPSLDATAAVVTGGTADRAVAGEAATVLDAMGAIVEWIEDVGVAHLGRILDHLDTLRDADVLVVVAGREGALPTVVAGLVDTPVIGVPVSSGYGHGGDGAAALSGMLQSCTVLSVVNVDAGFIAGTQAGLIARAVSDARDQTDDSNESAKTV